VAGGQKEDEGEIEDATALKKQLENTDPESRSEVDLTENSEEKADPVPPTLIANPDIAARAADEIMATHISLEPASSSKVEKPALVAPTNEELAMANRAELLVKANEAVKVYKEQTSSVLLPTHATLVPLARAPRDDAANMADDAATAAIAALASRPSIIINPIVAKMDDLANVVQTNIARRLGTPKPKPQPKPKPPTRQSARVRGRGAVKHTPEMNDGDASDDSRYDPDNMSDEDAAEGDSD
jgi:hypothetical protein